MKMLLGIYFPGSSTGLEFLSALLAILDRRVKVGNECLVTVRVVARELSDSFPEIRGRLAKTIGLTLERLGAIQWGLAASDAQCRRARNRSHSAKIYRIDNEIVNRLRLFLTRATGLVSPEVD